MSMSRFPSKFIKPASGCTYAGRAVVSMLLQLRQAMFGIRFFFSASKAGFSI